MKHYKYIFFIIFILFKKKLWGGGIILIGKHKQYQVLAMDFYLFIYLFLWYNFINCFV